MKVCLNARQAAKYLERVEEIIFDYRDKESINTYIDLYPKTTIILKYYIQDKNFNWEEIEQFNRRSDGKFILAILDPLLVPLCKEHQIKFYFAYPITSYDELDTVLTTGSYYVQLGPPLFFDLDNIKKFYPNAKIRLIPNVAYDDLYERENGITGTWVRPEDLKMYKEYCEAVEFPTGELVDVKREGALYRIYIEEHKWPGDLNMIITGLDCPGVNRLILSEVSEKRLNCRQICKNRKTCHICERALSLADEEKIEAYRESIETKYQAPKAEN